MKIIEKTDEATWLAERLKVITATEVGSLLGVNKFKSANKVKNDKICPSPFITNDKIISGNKAEDAIIHYGTYFTKSELATDNIFVRHDTLSLGATPDGVYKDGSLVEAKATDMAYWKYWKDCPPLYYVAQCHAQMMIMDTDKCWLVATFFEQWPFETFEKYTLHEEDDLMKRVTWEWGDRTPAIKVAAWKINRSKEIDEMIEEQVGWFWENFEKPVIRVPTGIKSKASALLEESAVMEKSVGKTEWTIQQDQLRSLKGTAATQAKLYHDYEGEYYETASRFLKFLVQLARAKGFTTRLSYIELQVAFKDAIQEAIKHKRSIKDIKELTVNHLKFLDGELE